MPYIVGNEACERFSYYGMKAILYAHLTSLYVLAGHAQEHAKDLGTATTHLFFAGVYALPMIGAILADRFAGKFATIFYLSLVYCLGHAVLAVGESTLTGMYIGLALIAVGSGGIKPCVSANVGDQFGRANWFHVRTVYQIFYFSINFGSFFSTLLIPFVKVRAGGWALAVFPGLFGGMAPERLGTSIAFAIPGIFMFIATVIFWLGRKKFVHVPPNPGGRIGLLDAASSAVLFLAVGHLFFTSAQPWWLMASLSAVFLAIGLGLFAVRQRLQPDDGFLAIMLHALGNLASRGQSQTAAAKGVASPLERSWFWGPSVRRFGAEAVEGPIAVLKILTIFVFVSVFWALFDQHASTWIRQAEQMDLRLWSDFTILPSQTQALNPLIVLVYIPITGYIYAALERRGIKPTALRRMTAGMLLTATSFVAVALIQMRIDGSSPGIVWVGWQSIPYLLMTLAEVLVSITGLEFAYTQAPKRMKSVVMGFWLLAVSLGNVLVAAVTQLRLSLANFFWVWAAIMGAAAIMFTIRSCFYVQKDFPQE